MDFEQAATGVTPAPAPIKPRVITSDTEGTFFFGTTELNHVLVKFLGLAAQAGHHVFVVTKRGGYEEALDNIRLLFRFAQRRLNVDLSSVRVNFKDELADILEKEGLGQPWVSFEDDIKQLQGPKAYASPIFMEEIVGRDMDRNLAEMRTYAKILGFGDEFEAYLREQPATPAPAPNSP